MRNYRQACYAAVLVALGTLELAGCGEPLTAPTSFAVYNSAVATYQCEYPADWEFAGGGKIGPEWASFSKGTAQIYMSADITGSALGDIAAAGLSLSGDGDVEPVVEIHEMGKEAAEAELSSYKEIGEPEVFSCQLGAACKSEFTAAGSFGGKLHGYRVTVLGRDKRVVVTCKSVEEDWPTVQPAFDRVINSLKPGKRQ